MNLKKSISFLMVFIFLFCIDFVLSEELQKSKQDSIKGIFVTIWTLTNKKKTDDLIALVEETELNAMVIDIKDNEGNLIFDYIKDVDLFIEKLNQKNIYLIGRMAVFRDSKFALKNPHFALQDEKSKLWQDNVGGKWVDPAAKESWSYNIQIAKKAIEIGFDELNFDYVRFPSEGDISRIVYPVWDGAKDMSVIIKDFFRHLNQELKPLNKPLSIDLFAYTVLEQSHLGIGQRFIDCLNCFDYVCLMVYPSHYRKGNFGFKNPAEHPYEVVYRTLINAKKILLANRSKIKIRPWLQSFNLGAVYTLRMIKLEKKAVYDVLGADAGWLLWNARNVYKKDALEK